MAAAEEGHCGPVDVAEDELVDARLRAVGVDPMQVHYIINSHLHSGHAGGNALLPAATVLVQQPEWELGPDPLTSATAPSRLYRKSVNGPGGPMSTTQQPMADSRDMIVVHDMFRREFKAIPRLVSGVP